MQKLMMIQFALIDGGPQIFIYNCPRQHFLIIYQTLDLAACARIRSMAYMMSAGGHATKFSSK